MNNLLLKNYIAQSELSISGPLWIDESFEKKVKPLSEEDAFYKPQGYVNSIAQILDHLAQWKSSIVNVYNSIDGATRPEKNGFRPNEDLKHEGWQSIKDRFHKAQDAFINLLKEKDDTFLNEEFDNTEYPNKFFIEGLIHHDIYHLGQIGLIIKLLGE